MARIRSIKPEFFLHDGLAELSTTHRLLFIGLWTLADREGRLLDRPVRIKTTVLPYDRADVDRLLTELAEHREHFIVRYIVEGERYIQVSHFTEHQHPHVREPESKFPPPDAEHCLGTAQPDAGNGSAPGEPVGLLSLVSGHVYGLGDCAPPGKNRPEKPIPSRRVPPDFVLTDELRAFAKKRGLDGERLDEEFGAFRDNEFVKAHTDWPATFRQWVRNWVKWGGARAVKGETEDAALIRRMQNRKDW